MPCILGQASPVPVMVKHLRSPPQPRSHRQSATVLASASKMVWVCPKPSVVLAPILVLVMAAEPGTALKLEPTGTSSHIPPLLDCAPADPAPAATPSSNNLLSLLVALPAAAPTGSAAAESNGTFARAFCFGFGARGGGGSSPGDCLKCLSAAALDVVDGCHGRRRGAVWRAGCFLSYAVADTNASTAAHDEDASSWRGWFYDDEGTPTAALGSECIMGNRTAAAECSRCLNESARVVPALKEGRKLSLVHGDAAVVVGYACYLRVPLFHPTPRWETYVFGGLGVFDAVAVVLIEIGGLLFCIREAREFNPA